TIPSSWKASSGHGTPGKKNDVYTYVENDREKDVPEEFSLKQNFPNPFNPVIQINYSIARAGNVKLSIFDMLGKETAVLVNAEKAAGNYSVRFNASEYNLSSGIYFYRLEADGFCMSRKLLYMK
ncbi:MAG: T9SS type A sorting domain-containing protein, partial [Syntrophothermus sp.]